MKMKIGEAAQKVGVSVRSLRHLDSMGTLKPSFREPNGNRLYSEDDIDKLSYISLLQLAGFTLREIPALLSNSNVQEEFDVHCKMLLNKGRYYQILGESLAEICQFVSLKNAPDMLEEFRDRLNRMSEQFHSEQEMEEQENEDLHQALIVLMRRFAESGRDHIRDYKQLIQAIPQLLNESFFDSFMLMFRMHKSNAFKLGELDQIEKKIATVKKQLESDIV